MTHVARGDMIPFAVVAQGLQQLSEATQLLVTEVQAQRDERAAERAARERRETECQ